MQKYLIVAALALLPIKSLLAADYTIDPGHTYVSFAINHLGFSTMRGKFDRQSGSLQFDPAAKKASVTIEIDVGSAAEPFDVVLVWTDPPVETASPSARVSSSTSASSHKQSASPRASSSGASGSGPPRRRSKETEATPERRPSPVKTWALIVASSVSDSGVE